MLLPSLVTLRRSTSAPPSPEDIFGSSLGGIFTDDLQNQHGDHPDTVILYRPSNTTYPELEFRTADVNGEEQRLKFAHYLWNAGVLMAELVGGRIAEKRDGGTGGDFTVGIRNGGEDDGDGWREGEWWLSREEEEAWSVRGEKVLELGAGVGSGGIMSALAGAEEVAITDYPAPPILEAITTNISKNVPASIQSRTRLYSHKWGDFAPEFAAAHAHRYTRILAADCLWMPYEHENLARSMLHFLSKEANARVYVIAGFHTGRAKMAGFFEETVPEVGLEIEDIFEMNAEGGRRRWAKERDGGREDIGERKKWLVVARLRRRVV